ncbi:MAG TPA: hypothetical protein VFA63_08750, partial [Pseudonocardiaceae bacterium]|nr:hypothetical protein [Pseudonocardiaceae bacterium]
MSTASFPIIEEAHRPPSSTPVRGQAVRIAPESRPTAGANWAPFGVVVPVLAGSAGAGASVFAAAMADALQRAGRCALLVDTAGRSCSGLCSASEVEGQHTTTPALGVRVRYSWRGHALLARSESDHGVAAVPELAPIQWLPLPPLEPLHVTVVDLGQDWTRSNPTRSVGACSWL